MQPSKSFNELVYALVRAIPEGQVLSYGRVALLLGVPNGARAVGWAMANLIHDERNVPWHRVVNAQGRVSIKGSPEGAAEQRARLEAEGIVFDERDALEMKQHLWDPSPDEVDAILQAVRLKAKS
jgi:methylated-DNA-protein-cysteine methyltransferase related protein